VNTWKFLEQWTSWYPETVPAGHLLRERRPEQWLRIYSLPLARRYPADSADWEELLRRHSTAAEVVLGRNAECALIAAFFGEEPVDQEYVNQFGLEVLGLVTNDFPEDDSDPADHRIDLYWAVTTWDESRFAEAIRARADDRGPSFLLAAFETGNVYAPYDGGADLFTATRDARTRVRNELRAWLSPRRDGL
jgi:hypothetical protein